MASPSVWFVLNPQKEALTAATAQTQNKRVEEESRQAHMQGELGLLRVNHLGRVGLPKLNTAMWSAPQAPRSVLCFENDARTHTNKQM